MKLSRNELAAARKQQKLRWNPDAGCYQVYTFANSQTLEFKWFHISSNELVFYRDELKLPIVAYEKEQQTSQPIAT